jgi:ABC-type multidrug transport system permease subunit
VSYGVLRVAPLKLTRHHSLVSMSEVQDSFHGRPVLVKHKEFAFFHPTAFVIAQIFSDIPILLVQITTFAIVVYFMTGLLVTAGAFFTYYAIVFTVTMVMTALFRACGSGFATFNAASKVSGLGISAAVTYAGYIIAKPDMHREWVVGDGRRLGLTRHHLQLGLFGFTGMLHAQVHSMV